MGAMPRVVLLGASNLTRGISTVAESARRRLGEPLDIFAPDRRLKQTWTLTDAKGLHRWPAAPAEMIFNAIMLAWPLVAVRAGWLPGNRFHVYLIAYGVFRFAHEFARDDVRMLGPIGGYHVLALAILGLGVWRLCQRLGSLQPSPLELNRSSSPSAAPPSST